MIEKILSILQKLDLKWWSTLRSQQKLNIVMAMIIISLSLVVSWFFTLLMAKDAACNKAMEELRKQYALEIKIERSRTDEVSEKLFVLLQKYEQLFFETRRIKYEVKNDDI